MSCEFCDELGASGICIPLGNGSVSFGIDFEDFETPMLYMRVETPSAEKARRQSAYFEAEVCPVCGRKIGERHE